MANSSGEKGEMIEQPLLDASETQKGGFRTLPFILGNVALMNAATNALTPNLILYLMNEYHMDMTTGSNILYIWSATTNIAPVLAAFLADSFVGRFKMIGLGSVVTLVGMFLFWLTSVIPQARPPPCIGSNNICRSAEMFQLFFLCSSLGLVAIGAGAIKSSSLAFGSDQLKREVYQENARAIESYFSWYYAVYALSVLVALTCLVYIQVNMGWALGFGAPVLLMLFSTLLIFLGTPFYVKLKPKSSLITGLIQVIVASYRNRCLRLSSQCEDILYHQKKGSVTVLPSEKLRFLNKACIVQDPQLDLSPDGEATDPWRLCTVDQVEELKALLNVVPIWLTGAIMNINISQPSFPVLQATTMDRHIGSSFEIPAASFGIFAVIAAIIWIVLYDCLVLPIASKMTGKPAHFSTKERMGFGMFLSFLSVLVMAVVEGVRRSIAIKEGYSDDPQSVIPMSAMWLLPQNCLAGFAEALNAIGQNEFYISEFPRSMSSVASALLGVGMGVASLLASFIMSTINELTGGGGQESWVSSNINKGHFDYYYLVLAGLSVVNLLCYIACSRAYGPCKGENREMIEED
ncbi:protein NRT1/ PTR FAMILY 1.2 [Nicotiana sylvestris]|uniref:Protein NRT1/ PTR FAMILY 1.2 n=1 Tax=Nicotiana sylvestris TaxID=4096 RepID=A0A1U7X8C7_NICSY|nr:PREDICTED: protein NRT1/ PTR FAMILY 1.2 [Nicotiana sylvestris]XP_016455815.1 PREDICTED: protein NRT1/ PTR FAMILY 1.2-like [Nicotiana tabacum]